MLFALKFTPNIVSERVLHFGLHISDDNFTIVPLETPISLRSTLCVSLSVYIVVSFLED